MGSGGTKDLVAGAQPGTCQRNIEAKIRHSNPSLARSTDNSRGSHPAVVQIARRQAFACHDSSITTQGQRKDVVGVEHTPTVAVSGFVMFLSIPVRRASASIFDVQKCRYPCTHYRLMIQPWHPQEPTGAKLQPLSSWKFDTLNGSISQGHSPT